MKRALVVGSLLVALVSSGAAGSPVYNPRFGAPPGHHALGELVAIRLVNEGTTPVTMGETWDLAQEAGGGTAFYQWPQEELELGIGESRVWTWDQRVNQCYGECQNVRAGDPAPAGRYEVTTTVDGNEETAKFTIGQYFTLGFEGRAGVEFTVFVGTPDEIEQMEAEAAAENKTLIVSGIVRKERSYNSEWNFSMGPHSIELGEVFIEVCDGSPFYVQRHRKSWLGERWCPWGSYVKQAGR